MDDKTISYYNENAKSVSEEYNRGVSDAGRYFSAVFVPGMKVLDIGCGSGRDIQHLLREGIDAYGVDPSDEMLLVAIKKYPHLKDRITKGGLPNLGTPFNRKYDGIICSAVLMHLCKEELFDAAFAIKKVLNEDGVLLVSVPENRPGIDEHQRDSKGRLFNHIQPEYLQLLFDRLGFSVIGKWKSDDSLGRERYSWLTITFRLKYSAILRPIDKVESILTRDKKTATYKLALIRALSEIALTESKSARWLPDGKVEVPLLSIAEKWLCYYWPLFESNIFIPQIRGEEITCSKPVAFRVLFRKLIEGYQYAGGLTRFFLDYRADKLSMESKQLLMSLLKKIGDTIVNGPVTFSGGSLESGRVFGFNSCNRNIIIDSELWIELSLAGYWIRDAVILRWAELTSALAKKSIMPSAVIDLLLSTPEQERVVRDARLLYKTLQNKQCTWTGKDLLSNFDVDHIIPFSLWQNNDLWNLMPVSKIANNQKRDKLPENNLLAARKDCIIFYWGKLRSAHENRFDTEASKMIGTIISSDNWENLLFQSVSEAIETTAIQKGCERWQPM